MFARLSRYAGLALAALALATSINITPVAQAAAPADLVPEPADPAYQVFGQVFLTKPDGSVDMNAHTRAYFRVTNIGGSSSGNILISPRCIYTSNNTSKSYTLPPTINQPLGSGGSTVVWFDCYRHSGEGMPTGAKLIVRGVNEPDEKLNNNTASMTFSYTGN